MEMPTKAQMVDASGRPITQSMFLEIGYSDAAIYTLKDDHYEYKGKVYPSLKRLYLETNDPTEYTFATNYLLSWKHWMRICENKQLMAHIREWRDELEMKIRAKACKEMMLNSSKGVSAASKWLLDKGWAQRGAGRPSKAEIEREKKIQATIASEYDEDVVRLFQQKQ